MGMSLGDFGEISDPCRPLLYLRSYPGIPLLLQAHIISKVLNTWNQIYGEPLSLKLPFCLPLMSGGVSDEQQVVWIREITLVRPRYKRRVIIRVLRLAGP